MGQQNLFDYNQKTLFTKHSKSLINQVEMWYINDKFAITTDYKEEKALMNYLLQDLFKTNDCELMEAIDRKLKESLCEDDSKNYEAKNRIINNYYYTVANYEILEF